MSLSISTSIMIVVVILIAIWMASVFTKSITKLIKGITRFRHGERQFRFNAKVKDEMGMLADSFDDMANSIVESFKNPLVITDLNQGIIYANDEALRLLGRRLEEIIGKPYSHYTLYQGGDIYSPIKALENETDTEVFYYKNTDKYFKGKATYLKDTDGKNIGYIIMTNDVTEIAKAVNAARAANESKSNFLARMSHEIRTPMNAIIGIVSIIKQKIAAMIPQQGDLMSQINQVETSSKYLLGLLNDVLDISKIEAGKIELMDEDFELETLIGDVRSIIEPRCAERGVKFNLAVKNFENNNAHLSTDSLRLRQVLINLLGNSVKFTSQGGKIDLIVEKIKSQDGKVLIRFEVDDTGIGIEKDAIKTLFEPFNQASSQITRKYGGTGLGLTISRNIVNMMGGEISVESILNEGSKFSFQVWIRENAQRIVSKTVDNSVLDFTGKKALLVDDNAVNRMIVREVLSKTKIEIDEAENGVEAVEKFGTSKEKYYDVILMDIQMPQMDGNEAAKAIRAFNREDAKNVPIIALTANAFKDDIDKAVSSGMNDHIAKPIDADKLMRTIAKYI